MKCDFDIIIIGCGAVSVSFLYQLKEQALLANRKFKIAIFDSSDNIASGYAYNCKEEMLLNTRVEEMGISPLNLKSFADWLNNKGLHTTAENFLPRSTFLQYIKSEFCILANNNNVVDISVIHSEVTDYENMGEFILITAENKRYTGEIVIFSHGGTFLPFTFRLAAESDQFIQDPYKANIIKNIPHNSSILILGANLSMVDTYLTLKKMDRNLSIKIMSRSGHFPSKKIYALDKIYGEKMIMDINTIVRNSRSTTYTKFINFLDNHFSQYLGYNFSIINEAEKYNQFIDNNLSIDVLAYNDKFNLSPLGPYIDYSISIVWKIFTSKDKQKLQTVVKYLLRFITGIPKENLDKLKQLSPLGMYVDKISSLVHNGQKFLVTNKSKSNKVTQFDYVINCTGIAGYYHNDNKKALTSNIINKSKFRITNEFGLQVNDNNSIIGKNGYPIKNTFAIGVAAIGSDFINSSFSFYVKQNASLVKTILHIE